MSISLRNMRLIENSHSLSAESIFFCEFPDYNSNLNPFNYPPLITCCPVNPVNNIIYFFICYCYLPL